MPDVTAERWESLRLRRSACELITEPVEEGWPGGLLGVDEDGRLHLLVAVEGDPATLSPDLRGIEVRVVEDGGTWLDVSARGHHEELFTLLANGILRAIRAEGRDPAASVESELEELRAALRPVPSEFGDSKQIGLFGELWALSNVLLPTLGGRACRLWSGPDGERHDFVGLGVHVEVKATTRGEQRHEISRLDQLRAPPGKRLLLASVLLERSRGGELTLADLIDEVIAKLGQDWQAIDALEDGLKRLGWNDGLRQSGALLRFSLREAHVFEVEGSFPRLPDDYEPPRGVTGVKYVIDVSSRPSLSTSAVEGILRAM